MKFWHSIYYIGHLGLPIFYVLGIIGLKPVLNKFLPSFKKDDQHSDGKKIKTN